MSAHDDTSIDVSEIAPMHLELETARAHEIVGPYGAYVGTMAPSDPAPEAWQATAPGYGWQPPAPRSSLRARVDRISEALAVYPFGLWKRVAFYTLFFMVVGNVVRCRGLSTFTNASCVLLIALGIAGSLAASTHRNP